MRLSVCAFCIRVEALYTLKHHPAESVTSDFFIADPIYTEITNAVHVTSLPARCMYVCTLRMLMKNTVQLVQQVHIHRCLIVRNAITIVNSAKVCVLANL